MVKYMGRYKEIERNLITKYRKDIWSKFVKGISEYKMIKEIYLPDGRVYSVPAEFEIQ